MQQNRQPPRVGVFFCPAAADSAPAAVSTFHQGEQPMLAAFIAQLDLAVIIAVSSLLLAAVFSAASLLRSLFIRRQA
jgi:hypothetical protein